LVSENFEVDFAGDGESAIQLGQNQAYDIIIADLSLPDMNGLEVIKEIKYSTPEIIPIIITGNGSMQSSLEAIKLEVCDYLEKPLSLDSVRDAISRGLQKREMMRQTIENKAYQKLSSDSFTGLPDRSLFMDRLNKAIDPDANRSFAVFLINIDHFKGVNDTYGHRIGDMALFELSDRFKSCVRPADIVARINGDEFAVLVEAADSEEMVTTVAERCLRGAEKIISIDGIKMNLSVSFGVVAKTLFYQSADDVLRDAELALSRCKEQGGGRFKLFDTNMMEQAVESLQLENELRLGIQNQEYILHYQPIVRLVDMRIVGLEALVRWNHPDHGIIYPDQFVPRAEDIGLKLVIDDFGTGYSSFTYLQQFPLDELKIGKSFIQKLEADTETFEIVKSIASLAKKLGLNVVAEGVETEEHLTQVNRLDFDMVQGFWIAKPGDAATVIKRIEKFL
jgi:diguanylate cyclase (GGDEF)-like protein